MSANNKRQSVSSSSITDLNNDALLKVTGGSNDPFINAAILKTSIDHGQIKRQQVKTEVDHHGLFWRKKAEEKKIKLTFADGHKKVLSVRRELD